MNMHVRIPYLTHNDDGKGKYQSHTVGCCTPDDWLSNIEGYGSTREEALNDFINEFKYSMNNFAFYAIR